MQLRIKINIVIVITAATAVVWRPAAAEPQTKLLNQGCSQYNATNISDFYSSLNGSLSSLRAQLAAGKHFATAQHVYALVECRNYLSTADCVACFAAAAAQIRNCSAANGARVIYDGCFLSKRNISENAAAFRSAVLKMLLDLQVATPKIKGFFAAVEKKEVNNVGGGNVTVYGVAQCVETATQSGCESCLKVAYDDLQSCLPNAEGRAVDAGCFLRYSNTSFFAANQTINLGPFLKSSGSSSKKAIIGGVIGGAGVLFLLLGFFLWFKRSRKSKTRARGDILGATELQGPVNYRYKDLKSATKNFSEENKLGEGGFGDIYKGTLKNGKIVAVKKLAIGQNRRAKAEFESEVKLISNVHHRNLIRLLGCSNEGSELLLVFEYMPNSSLDKFLFGERRGFLNWKQRFDIIMGTARGLAYLHEEFHVCIIHRDIKTSNILLDDDFLPKIADFGLARLLPEDRTHLSTRFAGTLGYTAPEYAIHGQLSEKADTYSYGVVVLEILSGQKGSEIKEDDPVGEYLLQRPLGLNLPSTTTHCREPPSLYLVGSIGSQPAIGQKLPEPSSYLHSFSSHALVKPLYQKRPKETHTTAPKSGEANSCLTRSTTQTLRSGKEITISNESACQTLSFIVSSIDFTGLKPLQAS
ncbi:hypothetical protein UlMin_019048 [Ulmus minor]